MHRACCRSHGPHAPEDKPPSFEVDLLSLVAGSQPFLGHHVVCRIVAPPSAIALGWRQLESQNPLYLSKRHGHCFSAARLQECPERLILTHCFTCVVLT